MASENQIKKLVVNYLIGDIQLPVFVQRFWELCANIEEEGDHDAVLLAHHIEGSLADVAAGHDEPDLRASLVAVLSGQAYAEITLNVALPVPAVAAYDSRSDLNFRLAATG